MTQSTLLEELKSKTSYCIQETKRFQLASDDDLRKSSNQESWNTLQCIEHLNRYGKFYLPEFKKRLLLAKHIEQDLEFSSTFLGKKFCSMMLPRDKKFIKMNSFKSKIPKKGEVNHEVLNEFLEQQQEMLKVLDEAEKADLNKNKCTLTIPLIRMNLGDTLRFVIYHHIRHIEQAKKAIRH